VTDIKYIYISLLNKSCTFEPAIHQNKTKQKISVSTKMPEN